MVLNFTFIPLVYFCYPETANLTLEEIDYIFTHDSMGAVATSKQMRKERVKYGHKESFVGDVDQHGRRASMAERMGRTTSRDDGNAVIVEGKGIVQHQEKV